MEKINIPVFDKSKHDYTEEWVRLLQGTETDFPAEASIANHFFDWPHIVNGQIRDKFDCTKTDSYQFVPPKAYLEAYRKAKEKKKYKDKKRAGTHTWDTLYNNYTTLVKLTAKQELCPDHR